jgi:hypothetical protein
MVWGFLAILIFIRFIDCIYCIIRWICIIVSLCNIGWFATFFSIASVLFVRNFVRFVGTFFIVFLANITVFVLIALNGVINPICEARLLVSINRRLVNRVFIMMGECYADGNMLEHNEDRYFFGMWGRCELDGQNDRDIVFVKVHFIINHPPEYS